MDVIRGRVSGENVYQSMVRKGLQQVPHHKCSMCGTASKFERTAGILTLNVDCDCDEHMKAPKQYRVRKWEWSEIANLINTINSDFFAASFGLRLIDESDIPVGASAGEVNGRLSRSSAASEAVA